MLLSTEPRFTGLVEELEIRIALDPFVLARTIDQQLERIYALASRHHRPDAPAGAVAPRAEVRRRGNQRLSIKPQPRGAWKPTRPVTTQTAR